MKKIDWIDITLKIVGIINGLLAIVCACCVDSDSLWFLVFSVLFSLVAFGCVLAWHYIFEEGEWW